MKLNLEQIRPVEACRIRIKSALIERDKNPADFDTNFAYLKQLAAVEKEIAAIVKPQMKECLKDIEKLQTGIKKLQDQIDELSEESSSSSFHFHDDASSSSSDNSSSDDEDDKQKKRKIQIEANPAYKKLEKEIRLKQQEIDSKKEEFSKFFSTISLDDALKEKLEASYLAEPTITILHAEYSKKREVVREKTGQVFNETSYNLFKEGFGEKMLNKSDFMTPTFKTTKSVKEKECYSIKFSDDSKLEWDSLASPEKLSHIKAIYEAKMQELSSELKQSLKM